MRKPPRAHAAYCTARERDTITIPRVDHPFREAAHTASLTPCALARRRRVVLPGRCANMAMDAACLGVRPCFCSFFFAHSRQFACRKAQARAAPITSEFRDAPPQCGCRSPLARREVGQSHTNGANKGCVMNRVLWCVGNDRGVGLIPRAMFCSGYRHPIPGLPPAWSCQVLAVPRNVRSSRADGSSEDRDASM